MPMKSIDLFIKHTVKKYLKYHGSKNAYWNFIKFGIFNTALQTLQQSAN